MSNANSCIDKVRFDLSVSGVAQGRSIMERVSGFGRQRLPNVLAVVLDRLHSEEQVSIFDLIELDIGRLPESRMERHLEQQIEHALRDFLSRHGVGQSLTVDRSATPAASNGEDEPRGRTWELLCQVFSGDPIRDANHIVEFALQHWRAPLLRLLRDLGRKQAVRQRLSHRLSTHVIELLLHALEPSEAPMIVSYVADVRQLHQRSPLVPENARSFAAVMWEFVLSYLLLERGSYFNTKMLVGHTLMQIARRYRVAYKDLLLHLTGCLTQYALPLSNRDNLQGILLDLSQAEAASIEPIDATPNTASLRHGAMLQWRLARVAEFLERGVWAEPAIDDSEDVIVPLLATVIEQSPDALLALLRKIGVQQIVRQRLARQFPEPQKHQLLELIEPVHGVWIGRMVRKIEQIQARKRVVHDDSVRFGQRLWEFVFCALLVERGSDFNSRSFIKSLLQQLAAHYSVSYRTLLHALIGLGLDTVALASRRPGLPFILHSLLIECERSQGPASVTRNATVNATLSKTTRAVMLRHLLASQKTTGGLRILLADTLRQSALRAGVDYAQLLSTLLDRPGPLSDLLKQHNDVTSILLTLSEDLRNEGGTQPSTNASASKTWRDLPNFSRAAREFVLRSFQVERGSYFNNRSYIKSLLHQLSARHGISYANLLHGLVAQSGLEPADVSAQTSLSGILLSLKADATSAAQSYATNTVAASLQTSVDKTALLDPFIYFLTHGSLPPRVSGQQALRWDALIRNGLVKYQGKKLAAMLRGSVQKRALLERLLRYVPDNGLKRMLDTLSPDFGGFIDTWRLCVLALIDESSFSFTQRSALPTMAWRAIFLVLLDGVDGAFSPTQFLSLVGRLLASKLGLAPATLHARLLTLAIDRAANQVRYKALADLLAQCDIALSTRTHPMISVQNVRIASASDGDATRSLLQHWLQYGMTSVLRHFPGTTQQLLLENFNQELQARPTLARLLLLRAAGRHMERYRLAFLLPSAMRFQILKLLLGAHVNDLDMWRVVLAATADATSATNGATLPWDAILVCELFGALHRMRGRRLTLAEFLGLALPNIKQRHNVDPLAVLDAIRKQVTHTSWGKRESILLELNSCREKIDASREERAIRQHAASLQSQAQITQSLPEKQSFSISNAGLVILWPFLDKYFHLLGLHERGVFHGFAERCRAAHLLHYLSHGTLEIPEHDMLLNKILCGIDPVAALEVAGPLSEHERDTSLMIHLAVTQNWSKLKNTDIGGLQTTFLQRRGQLVRNESNWTLTVERESFDVLMSSLPWTISTIRLSWMEGILTVVWL